MHIKWYVLQIHMLNQDVHKNLRRNKSGIRLSSIEPLPPTYIRPAGFFLVPKLLNLSQKQTQTNQPLTNSKCSESPSHYNSNIKKEKSR